MESSTRSTIGLPKPTSNNGARPAVSPCGVLGIGSDAPELVLTNADLAQMVDTNDEWVVSRTGISERRIAGPHETTADLALRASQRALADAGVTADELDLVIVATVTADNLFPACASLVQDRLGASGAAAFDLAAGCSGFIYALAVGAQFVQTGLYRRVLVIGAERLSRITNWRDRATCVLFGDGAGAAVLGPVERGYGFHSFDLGSDGGGGPLLQVVPGGWGHPKTTGDESEMHHSIQMAGGEVFKFAVHIVEASSRRALERAGLDVGDVDLFVPHQANIRIIDAAVKRLGMPEERVFANVHRYGNTSAASIPLALDEACREGRVTAGDTVLLVGFGAGLSWASCVLTWGGGKPQ